MHCASFGSISSGTLRSEDLAETFADELDALLRKQPRSFKRAAYRKSIRETRAELRKLDHNPDHCQDELDACVAELAEMLGDFAPPYAYFGSREGDGADFGFWLGECAMEYFDGLRVSDTSEVPRDYRGEVLHVNDHGNATLYVAMSRGKLREVWAVV